MKVGVLGAGLMGGGISYVCALAQHETAVVDILPEALEKAQALHHSLAQKEVSRGRQDEPWKEAVLKRLSYSGDISSLAPCEVIIEAVVEDIKVKEEVLQKLEEMVAPETIVGTNTSSLPITRIAAHLKIPERVIGIHFFNPAPVMRLVEIIRGFHTSEAVFQKTVAFVQGLGKTVVVSQDFPGFITSRLGTVLMLEAIFALQEGVGKKEDIDEAMKLGYNHPMGPLALADLVGLDTLLHISEVLYESFQDPKYRAPWLLRQMVEAGKLGRKSGEGFYKY